MKYYRVRSFIHKDKYAIWMKHDNGNERCVLDETNARKDWIGENWIDPVAYDLTPLGESDDCVEEISYVEYMAELI
jgi:hypothetical protein